MYLTVHDEVSTIGACVGSSFKSVRDRFDSASATITSSFDAVRLRVNDVALVIPPKPLN